MESRVNRSTESGGPVALLSGDLAVASGLQTAMRRAGQSLAWCGSVREVRDALKGVEPPLVLVVDVSRRSRRMLRSVAALARRLPVVALTDPRDRRLARLCLEAGARLAFPRAPWAWDAVATCLAGMIDHRSLLAEMKQSAEEAREAHLQLVRVLEHCSEAAVVVREDGTALYANQAARWCPRGPVRSQLRLQWRGEPAVLNFMGSLRPGPDLQPREAAATL